MQSKYDIRSETEQESARVSQETAQLLETFLTPLIVALDKLLDKRLVRTFVQCCVAIMRFRNGKQGLLLSELGSYLGGYPGETMSAPAGTKRINNLLRSLKWGKEQIERFLRDEAEKEVKRLREQGKGSCVFGMEVCWKNQKARNERNYAQWSRVRRNGWEGREKGWCSTFRRRKR